jgi:hypothetical protein
MLPCYLTQLTSVHRDLEQPADALIQAKESETTGSRGEVPGKKEKMMMMMMMMITML